MLSNWKLVNNFKIRVLYSLAFFPKTRVLFSVVIFSLIYSFCIFQQKRFQVILTLLKLYLILTNVWYCYFLRFVHLATYNTSLKIIILWSCIEMHLFWKMYKWPTGIWKGLNVTNCQGNANQYHNEIYYLTPVRMAIKKKTPQNKR